MCHSYDFKLLIPLHLKIFSSGRHLWEWEPTSPAMPGERMTKRPLHPYRNFTSHLVETLHELGMSTIYLGYPLNVARDNCNKCMSQQSWDFNVT
ncbi:MAG: hypothetical protein RXS23_05670 [Metallosphaera yellowstonensis]